MEILEWVRFLAGVGLLLIGMGIFVLQLFGVFKFQYVLNRMHAAAMGDTLGIGVSLTGLMILSGFNFTSLKMALIIVFLWMASPVSSHLISRLEVRPLLVRVQDRGYRRKGTRSDTHRHSPTILFLCGPLLHRGFQPYCLVIYLLRRTDKQIRVGTQPKKTDTNPCQAKGGRQSLTSFPALSRQPNDWA